MSTKIFNKINMLIVIAATVLSASGWLWHTRSAMPAPIRIGVLHSLSGTMEASEKPLVDAARLAIEEINARGGLLGRPLEMVVADGKSDPAIFAAEAERLIEQEHVSVIFGCWTSSCRKTVKTVVEKHHHLLVYPVQYEGMEQSGNILYTGATPNQQIIPGTHWAMQQFGKRVYLVGSDYFFPHTANLIIRDQVNANNGTTAAEQYLPLGSEKVDAIIDDIRRKKPDVILNTLNGDSNAFFFAALKRAGLANLPLISFSVAEDEMKAWGGDQLTRHYAVWSYFQTLQSEENRSFVAAFQARFGAARKTSDPIVTTYTGINLWAQAVTNIANIKPDSVNRALLRQSISSPAGISSVDFGTRHLWRVARIGQIQADGQFKQVYASNGPLRPTPWPDYRSTSAWNALLYGESP